MLKTILLISVGLTSLTACGFKGDLYLPKASDDQAPKASVPKNASAPMVKYQPAESTLAK